MDFNSFNFVGDYAKASLENCHNIPEKMLINVERWLKSDDKPPLMFYGNPGSGKTYLAISIFRELCKTYRWVLYTKSDDLDREFLQAASDPGDDEGRVLLKYKEVPVLIWDELGIERPTDRIQRQFYGIIDYRMAAKMPTIFTTNCNREMIKDRLGERIASRLSICHVFQFPNVDNRLN